MRHQKKTVVDVQSVDVGQLCDVRNKSELSDMMDKFIRAPN